MTENYEKEYQLWDEFLHRWPIEKLVSMELDEYTQAGSQDAFTYWIETRLENLGSIWGGSAFKFGVYSRDQKSPKENSSRASYSENYAWYTALGNDEHQAFEKVREGIVRIAKLAQRGDLEGIEAYSGLGEAYKWKIAFHYQDRSQPSILCVFKPEALAAYLEKSEIKNTASLQKAVMQSKPRDMGVLEFGREVWSVWSQKNIPIWKVSHGSGVFSAEDQQKYLQGRKLLVHSETGKKQGTHFAEAPVGTLFYLCHGNNVQLLGRMVSGAVLASEGWLERSYDVIAQAVTHERYTHNSKYWSPQGNSTFYQVRPHDLPEFEETLLKPYFHKSLIELGEYYSQDELQRYEVSEREQEESDLPDNTNIQKNCFNRIYYGPPGTGKTYQLLKDLDNYKQDAESVSIKQRQDYFIAERFGELPWWKAIFCALYELGGTAKVQEILDHPFVSFCASQSNSNNYRAAVWANLQTHTIDESITVKYKTRIEPAIFDKTEKSVWQLAGDWQEACADLIDLVDQYKNIATGKDSIKAHMHRFSFTTFHQSYGYEEFVEGLRPVLNDETESGDVRYEIRAGVFKQLCEKARQNPGQRYAMVIDEINRGNISKIFGELITLIEPDKREGRENAVSVKLPYSGQDFSVPANVDIIGTMNTADRSLALLDTALRRRFEFVPLLPNTKDESGAPLVGLTVKTEQGVIDIRRLLEKINQRIEVLYDRDHTIGHAYFMALKDTDEETKFGALQEIFSKKILPLLEEYFFEDWQKIALVLGDNQKNLKDARFIIAAAESSNISSLFGQTEIDTYLVKEKYQLNESALSKPEAYIGVYVPEFIGQS